MKNRDDKAILACAYRPDLDVVQHYVFGVVSFKSSILVTNTTTPFVLPGRPRERLVLVT